MTQAIESLGITCLRCRHAVMVHPDNIQIILCGRRSGAVTEITQSACPLADPRMQVYGGDKVKKVSPLEIAYMRSAYADGSLAWLCSVMGRSRRAIYRLAQQLGLKRPHTAAVRWEIRRRGYIARTRPTSRSLLFHPAQRRYIEDVKRRGAGHWPGPWLHDPTLRNAIVARVAELGPPRSWTAIKAYACRAERRRAAERASRPN